MIDAGADSKGDITHVKFQGNSNYTSVARAIPITDRGEIDNLHVVRRKGAKTHLRTTPDDATGNNLDIMTDDT